MQGTADAHGKPPGDEELRIAKEKMGWPTEPHFYVPDDVLAFYRQAIERGAAQEDRWQETLKRYKSKHPHQANEFERRIQGKLPDNWQDQLPVFPSDAKGMGSRSASGKVLNAVANVLPELMGGSADLTPSNNTWIKGGHDFQADSPDGRYIRFGVREHAMGAILNGLAVHSGIMPYGASFLVFTDYARPAIRLSALMGLPVKWIFTHDSIGVGEDGPTHQPIEHIASLRAIPNLVDIRPADANEVAEAWRVAILSKDKPVLMALSRQNLPTLDREALNPASGLSKGAYVLKDFGTEKPQLILIASGSEVSLIVEAAQKLAQDGLTVRVVSMPSWFLFTAQSQDYRDSVLLPNVKQRLAVEAGTSFGWERWVGCEGKMIGIDRFGESGPAQDVFKELGLTVEAVYEAAKGMLNHGR